MPHFEDDNLNLPEDDYVPVGGASDDDGSGDDLSEESEKSEEETGDGEEGEN